MWKTQNQAVGSDLGHGKFQFQLTSEEDLQLVLANRPYHYAKWMVIIQRWEPTLAPNFPSEIPFWVTVQGVPLHLWSEETIRSIGVLIGKVEETEITINTLRMRVVIDGLQPLVMSAIVEFEGGKEVETTLLYEKLEKYCLRCLRLDHEEKDCLEPSSTNAKKDASYHQENQTVELEPRQGRHVSSFEEPWSRRNHEERRGRGYEPNLRGSTYHFGTKIHREQTRQSYGESRHEDRYEPRRPVNREAIRQAPPPADEQRYRKNYSHHSQPIWREIRRNEIKEKTHVASQGDGLNSIAGKTQDEMTPPPYLHNADLPQNALMEAMGDIRAVMEQYSNCADPNERAARKERFRLAEEAGEVEETAASTVRVSLQNQLASREKAIPEQDMVRNLATDLMVPQKELPQEAIHEAMRDIRRVMGQYSKLQDPTENAARKERVRRAEEAGEVEEVAIQMVRTNLLSKLRPTGMTENESEARLVLDSNRGELIGESSRARTKPRRTTTAKRNLGPAGKRKIQISPKVYQGSNSRKRKTTQTNSPPRRRLRLDNSERREGIMENSRNARDHGTSPSKSVESIPQDNPPIRLVPAINKKKMDFRNSSRPLP